MDAAKRKGGLGGLIGRGSAARGGARLCRPLHDPGHPQHDLPRMCAWSQPIDPGRDHKAADPRDACACGGTAMTGNPWLAALMALFLWWFSTGIILWRVRRADNGGPDDHLLVGSAGPVPARPRGARFPPDTRRRLARRCLHRRSSRRWRSGAGSSLPSSRASSPGRTPALPRPRAGMGAVRPRLRHHRLARDPAGRHDRPDAGDRLGPRRTTSAR